MIPGLATRASTTAREVFANARCAVRAAAWIGAVLLASTGCTTSPETAPPDGRAAETMESAAEPTESVADPTRSSCGCAQPAPIARSVREVAVRLEAQRIYYGTIEFSDCSGIFHRLSRGVAELCPCIAVPEPEVARSSRQLGAWFHEHGDFTRIRDPIAQSELIQPGVILFFGRRGVDYRDTPTDQLFVRGVGIRHMGVVTEIEVENGRLVGYEMFHGTRKPHHARVTNYHKLTSKPPFGTGAEPLVAVSNYRAVR